MRNAFFGPALAIATLLTSFGAHATPTGTRVDLESIPLADEEIAKAHGKMRIDGVRKYDVTETLFVTDLGRAVCIGQAENGNSAAGALELFGDSKGDVIIERIIEGDAPVLDRMVINRQSDPASANVIGRSRLPLTKIEAQSGINVYAYRTAKTLRLLVPRGFNNADQAFLPRWGTRMACGFFSQRLVLSGDAVTASVIVPHALSEKSRWMMTRGELFDDNGTEAPFSKETSAEFVLNASVSQLARDPAPVVSIFLRAVPPAI